MHMDLNGFKKSLHSVRFGCVVMFRCSRFYWINWHKYCRVKLLFISSTYHTFYYLLHNKIFICARKRSGRTWSFSHNITPLNTIFSAAAAVAFSRAFLIDFKANKARSAEREEDKFYLFSLCAREEEWKNEQEDNLNEWHQNAFNLRDSNDTEAIV